MVYNMTLELSQEIINSIKVEVEKSLDQISNKERNLYSREEVENMLLDIYCLLIIS